MGKRKERTRSPRGTGTVFHSKARKLWVARKPIGRRKGRTVYLERTGATQAEAMRRRDQALPPGPRTTVAQWCTRWLSELNHRPLTMDSYRRSVTAWITPALGDVPLRVLTPHAVESAARLWGKSLSANTVRLVLAHLRAALGAAVRAGAIAVNPVASAQKPRGTRKLIEPFTPAELARIIAEAARSGPDRILALLAATGCRRGEALALDVSDYDSAAGTIAITKTDIGKHGIGPPKSALSRRTIRVPTEARAALDAARGRRTTGPLFRGLRRARMNDSVAGSRFAKLLARLGIPRRNLHQLRHSVATALIAAGCPLPDVAAYLGDRVETVVRTYLHPTGGDPALVMERLLGGDKVVKPDANNADCTAKQE